MAFGDFELLRDLLIEHCRTLHELGGVSVGREPR